MKLLKILLFIFAIACSQAQLNAQYFNSGQDPASIKWKQINTSNFQIIFPVGYEKNAKYMAAIFTDLLQKGGKNLNHQPKKFSVVLHTQNATSNGMVAWAPKRMELFTTSPQNNDAQLWLDHLATHEYRHVIQLDKIEQGFTRLMNYVFGQSATAVVVGMYLPPWFLEGDAVCIETSLSESGRGRFPTFEQELRAQLLEKGRFSYDKAVNGSYKDFVPDRYTLGYYLVGKGRVNYGDELWNSTLNRVGKRPYGITTFSRGLNEGMKPKRDKVFEQLSEKQKNILAKGIKVDEIDWQQVKKLNKRADGKLLLYYDTMEELKWEWQVQDAQNQTSSFTALSEREPIFTNKRYPHVNANGDLIVYKEGLADAGYFAKIDQAGNESKVFTPGYTLNASFDLNKETLLWAERESNIRWEKADKSVIVSYNIKTGERRKYKTNTNCFAPSFSPDGNRIACVEVDQFGKNALLIIDAQSGKELKRYPAKAREYYMTPQWDGNNQIVLIQLDHKGKHLLNMNLNGEKKTLFSSGKHEMSQPVVGEQHIFFSSAFTGIDNIFALDKNSGKVFQVTSSRFGAKDPYLKNNKLYYANYTSDGYIPVEMQKNKANWKEWKGNFAPFHLAEELSDQLGEKLVVDTTNTDQFEVKNYSKLGHLFNVHSWAPVFIDGIDQKTDIGVSIATQNKLSTLMAVAGYKKEEGFDKGQFYANLSYRGWFPILDSKITVGDREVEFEGAAFRLASLMPGQEPVQDSVLINRQWRQWEWENSISLPFDLSRGQYSTKIIPKVTYNLLKYANIKSIATPLSPTNNNSVQYHLLQGDLTREVMEYQLFAYNIGKTAPRDVQYQWAQILEFNYRNTPFGDTELGNTWSAEGTFYTPGFDRHHGMIFYGGYQKRSRYNSAFSNIIKSPRGMKDLYGEDVITLGVDYALPLFYPEWNIGPLAYFKRIEMKAFFDYGYAKGRFMGENEQLFSYKNKFASYGAEFRTDMHALRFPAPISVGCRVGYEEQSKGMFFDLLLGISLSSF